MQCCVNYVVVNPLVRLVALKAMYSALVSIIVTINHSLHCDFDLITEHTAVPSMDITEYNTLLRSWFLPPIFLMCYCQASQVASWHDTTDPFFSCYPIIAKLQFDLSWPSHLSTFKDALYTQYCKSSVPQSKSKSIQQLTPYKSKVTCHKIDYRSLIATRNIQLSPRRRMYKMRKSSAVSMLKRPQVGKAKSIIIA